MKFNKIVFLMRTIPTQRDYKRFGVEILKAKGFRVLIIDLSEALLSGHIKKYSPPDQLIYEDQIKFSNLKSFYSFLDENIDENREAFFIDLFGFDKTSRSIYRKFRKMGLPYAVHCANSAPDLKPDGPSTAFTGNKNKNASIKFIALICRVFFKGVRGLRNCLDRFLFYAGWYQSPKIVLAAGVKNPQIIMRIKKDAEILQAHTFDYDLYLERSKAVVVAHNYCVFLDSYFPFHPDFLLLGNKSMEKVDPEKYYEGLNRFFDNLERQTGKQVIIAAHPRSKYEEKPWCFKSRKVIRGKTIDLVASAEYVILHCSTAINFAVMYKKPLVFLVSDQLNLTPYGTIINNYAKYFKKSALNVDRTDNIDLTNELNVNDAAYQNYLSEYIKSPGTPEKPFWEIVADKILAL